MALTLTTLQTPQSIGSTFRSVTQAVFDNSYAEGGEAFTPANAGLAAFDHAPQCQVINGSEAEANPVDTSYHGSEKLHLIDGKTSKEMAATKNMEKVKVIVTAFGKTRAK